MSYLASSRSECVPSVVGGSTPPRCCCLPWTDASSRSSNEPSRPIASRRGTLPAWRWVITAAAWEHTRPDRAAAPPPSAPSPAARAEASVSACRSPVTSLSPFERAALMASVVHHKVEQHKEQAEHQSPPPPSPPPLLLLLTGGSVGEGSSEGGGRVSFRKPAVRKGTAPIA